MVASDLLSRLDDVLTEEADSGLNRDYARVGPHGRFRFSGLRDDVSYVIRRTSKKQPHTWGPFQPGSRDLRILVGSHRLAVRVLWSGSGKAAARVLVAMRRSKSRARATGLTNAKGLCHVTVDIEGKVEILLPDSLATPPTVVSYEDVVESTRVPVTLIYREPVENEPGSPKGPRKNNPTRRR